jgi:hypothetical protein
MKILDYEIFKSKVLHLNDEYWNNTYKKRWDYISVVTSEISTLKPTSILELGPYKISLSDISDSMGLDKSLIDKDNINNLTYIQNAKTTPWPIEDKKYDLFIALQVMEHLSPNQSEIFDEIKRISKYAIISVPYLWNVPDDKTHNMIDDKIIKKWTNNEKYYKSVTVGSPTPLRKILFFKF